MIWPFLMIYVKGKLELPISEVTILLTINAIAGTIAGFMAGPITDWIGRKWAMVFSLAGNGIIYLLLGRAETMLAFAVMMALSGSFNPVYRVGGDAMVADLVPPDQRADAYAMLRLSNNLGIALGPMIGGFLAGISYSIAFICAAIGMISYGLLLAFFASETLPKTLDITNQPSHKSLGGYSQILRDSPFLSFIGLFTLTQVCSVLIWTLMPAYTYDHYQISERQYGFIPTTNAVMVVFLQIYVTQFTKRYHALPTMAVGTLFYALAVGSVALDRSFWGFWATMVVMTIGELILMPTASTYIASLAPMDKRGRYMSLASLTFGLAFGTAPLMGSYLGDHVSPFATWYGGLLVGIAAVLGYSFLYIRRKAIMTIHEKTAIGE